MSASTAPQLYLVPCTCGKKVRVRARQAGEQVTCECGATVNVPTIRGLKQLETVVDEAAGPAVQRSSLQGPLFSLGILALFVGSLILLGILLFPPANMNVDWQNMALSGEDAERGTKPVAELNVMEVYDEFAMFRDRARQTPWDQAREVAENAQARYRTLLTTGGVLFGAGALAMIVGLLLPGTKR